MTNFYRIPLPNGGGTAWWGLWPSNQKGRKSVGVKSLIEKKVQKKAIRCISPLEREQDDVTMLNTWISFQLIGSNPGGAAAAPELFPLPAIVKELGTIMRLALGTLAIVTTSCSIGNHATGYILHANSSGKKFTLADEIWCQN